ncbi:hypothetical protein [Mesorhizobium sp. WSM3868]|nr:hypothetical protein [Mesorhizobium sp. WSM3868]
MERLESPITKALEFLELLESMQELHEQHLTRLLAKAGRHDAA